MAGCWCFHPSDPRFRLMSTFSPRRSAVLCGLGLPTAKKQLIGVKAGLAAKELPQANSIDLGGVAGHLPKRSLIKS